jgi:6-pyruvoyltetrahydropterin/6-carboxytetrahydropterin synthase
MEKFLSTKVIELGSCAFRQPKAKSHCSKIHGYRLKAKIWFEAETLDENNWIMDFGGLKDLKDLLQKTFDHKLVIDKNDPAKSALKEVERYGAADIVVMDNGVGVERFAEFVFKEADNFVKYKTSNRVSVKKVEVFEHEDNSAIYERVAATHVEVSKPTNITPIQEIKLESPYSSEKINPDAAPLHNKVTTGYGNPFAGTSWGS